MDDAVPLAVMSQAVVLPTFWPTVASHASPATQQALAGTSCAARDAAVRCAPRATLTLQLSPPPSPATLGMLRSSGRTLPAAVIISNNDEQLTPLFANRIARLILPQVGCAALTSLQLGGGPWLVDTALLADVCAALPRLQTLVLSSITMPLPHLPAPAGPAPPHLPAPAVQAPTWPSLRTVSVTVNGSTASDYDSSQACHSNGAAIKHLLTLLDIRAGGRVTSLTLDHAKHSDDKRRRYAMWSVESAVGSALRGNQMHALRKLVLPDLVVWDWNPHRTGSVLIHNAPSLEHIKVEGMSWDPEFSDAYADDDEEEEHGTSAVCVPWRKLEVHALNLAQCHGLPLGSRPGQPPLILRVTNDLWCERDHGGDWDGEVGTQHLITAVPGKRGVQLECTRAAYHSISTDSHIDRVLRVLTLSTTGLSNLILDGIDSADDSKGLVELGTTGLVITLNADFPFVLEELEGLRDLPQVTRLEVKADKAELWGKVDERLLACLPAHVTDVRLSGQPSLELVSSMCVHVSRVPHCQARRLQLCVPGVVGWFDAVGSALAAAGIATPGVVGVPHN